MTNIHINMVKFIQFFLPSSTHSDENVIQKRGCTPVETDKR